MNHNAFKGVLWGLAMLSAVTAGAQEYESELQVWDPLDESETTYWYRICSALPELEGYAVTDYSEEDDIYPLQLLQTEEKDYRSQWKLAAGAENKVILVNRATGQEIDGCSLDMGSCNVTQIMPAGITTGFVITALGNNAFSLQSVEDDGINRCLAVADVDSAPISYPTENESTSAIGWKFITMEISGWDGIESAKPSKTSIRISGKRISVSGVKKWQLFNAQGEEMPRTTRLAAGIYMVKLPGKTVKVLIQ